MWPEGLAHYVEKHGVRLPDEVVGVAARGVASGVHLRRFTSTMDSGRLTVDVEWWRRQAGPGQDVAHLPGCRHSATVASWDLPAHADIYVDRVPEDAVPILVELRRLLGIAWPFSELRNLLGAQPIHAVAGNPATLYRRLTTAPELRPYLFYEADGGLLPVWSGAGPTP